MYNFSLRVLVCLEDGWVKVSLLLKTCFTKQLKSITGGAIHYYSEHAAGNWQLLTPDYRKPYCDPLVSGIMLTKAYHILEAWKFFKFTSKTKLCWTWQKTLMWSIFCWSSDFCTNIGSIENWKVSELMVLMS